MLTLNRGRKVPVVTGQKAALSLSFLTILQVRLSSIRFRMVSGPFVLPLRLNSMPIRQGRRPRSSPPEGRALGEEELRFRAAGTEMYLSRKSKPINSKVRRLSAGGLFLQEYRSFADPKTHRSADLPSAVVDVPAQALRTSIST